MATVLEQYNDPNLPAIIQPVRWSVPWPVVPKASDFDASIPNAAPLPIVSWSWQFWEDDARVLLTNYLENVAGIAVGDLINDLPANFLTILYRNVFENKYESFDAVQMVRLDNQLIGEVPHAIASYWVAYWLAMYLYDERATKANATPEDKFQMKVCRDIAKGLSFMLHNDLTKNPTVAKSGYLIHCSTKSIAERHTLFVDRDYLSAYLAKGGDLTELCVNYFNSGANPKKGTDF